MIQLDTHRTAILALLLLVAPALMTGCGNGQNATTARTAATTTSDASTTAGISSAPFRPSPAAPTASATDTMSSDPCKILTAQDAAALLGISTSVVSGPTEKGSSALTLCVYEARTRNANVGLTIEPAAPSVKNLAALLRRTISETNVPGTRSEPIGGLGEAAYLDYGTAAANSGIEASGPQIGVSFARGRKLYLVGAQNTNIAPSAGVSIVRRMLETAGG